MLLIAPVLFIALLARSADYWPIGKYHERPEDVDAWARGLLAIALLLVSAQLVTVLLVVEHTVGRSDDEWHGSRLALVWVGRLVVASGVLLAVLVNWPDPDFAPSWWDTLDDWEVVAAAAAGAELFAAVCLVAAWWPTRSFDPTPDTLEPDATPAKPYEPEEEQDPTAPPSLQALGASGGGIRAAAFVLGGHQAAQDRARPRAGTGNPADSEPHVFAVSGGSYVAAALALRRTYRADGARRQEKIPWTESYTLGSPELERLRRYTRYLFEPRWRMRDGLVTLLMGAAVNLVIIGVLLRFMTWVSAEFALTTGVIELSRDAKGQRIGLALAPGWSVEDWVMLLIPSLVCAAGILLFTFISWGSTSAFDVPTDDERGRRRRRKSVRRMTRAAKSRPWLFATGVAWIVLVVGLPAASVGVVELTTTNRPTQTAAGVLDSLGFGTRSLCTQALVDQVHDAVVAAGVQARVSPDERREVTAGACGVETTVARTLASGGTPQLSDDVLLPPDDPAARDLAETRRIPGQVAGLTAVLLFVLSLLRGGPAPEAAITEGWVRRLRRVAKTWVPLAIMLGVAAYLLLVWTLRFMMYMDPSYNMWAAGMTVAACLVAYLMDANATSVHNFYRGRLSEAFAVGVDDNGRATQLPSREVYRFSDLAQADPDDDSRLHVIATLNSKAPNEAPTMRGGFPLVFGARDLLLYREERQRITVPMRDYEEYAGAGRVSVMASVAISGAAISPLMGRYGSQTTPYRMLLALFNVRVGTWVSNPMHTVAVSGSVCDPDRRATWRNLLWMTRKPGLAQVALEAMGNSSANDRWVYLSDGGHLDNTGLVESVRHCVDRRLGGRVLILDASNDPPGTWSAVGDAIGVVRADLCVDLRRVIVRDEPPWMRIFQGSGLEVVVVKAVRVEAIGTDGGAAAPADIPVELGPTPGDAPSVPTDWLTVLPPNVISFQLTHRDFPRSSTSRQKFGDLEFEAYRSLGYACATASLEVADRARRERAEAVPAADASVGQ